MQPDGDSLKGAERLAREGKLEEALRLAREAAEAAPPGVPGLRATLAAAGILAELGESDEAAQLAQSVEAAAGREGDEVLGARARAILGSGAFHRGAFRDAAALLRPALEALGGRISPAEEAALRSTLAIALTESGDARGAREEAGRAAERAEASGDPLARGLAAAAEAWADREGAEGRLRGYLEAGPAPPGAAWLGRFALGERMAARGEGEFAAGEYAEALKALRVLWEALPAERRARFLSTALPRRFCSRLVADAGGAEAEGTALREIHRTILGPDAGAPPEGLEGPPARPEELAARVRNLLRLQEVTKAVNSELHLDRLLELIMDRAVEIVGAERGFLMLVEKGELRFRVARNLDQEKIRKPEFKISHSIAEEAFRTGKAILTANAKEDSRFQGAGSVHDLKLTSVLCLPLRIRDRVTGVLYLDNRFRVGQFGAEALQLLGAFCDQAAIALENARLYLENQRAAEEVRTLNQRLSEANAQLAARVKEQEAALEMARRVRSAPAEPRRYGALVARSPRMEEVFRLLDKVVDTEVPVLIQGESGTGKELVARVIHEKGPRARKPFVSENCGALSETLLESELFGHVRGAFTGAAGDRVGLFEVAHGGTLFLDEVGEMSPDMQKKLLRALQEGEIRPVGATAVRKVDVRVLAASNRCLKDLVREGRFREDLYFRLNVLEVDMPALRERPEDIPLLLDHFFGEGPAPTVGPAAMRRLLAYRWPGNVRELRNFVERMKALKVKEIAEADLPSESLEPDGAAVSAAQGGPLDELEERLMRGAILKALRESGGNKTKAAEKLGVPKTTLYNKMKKYGIGDTGPHSETKDQA